MPKVAKTPQADAVAAARTSPSQSARTSPAATANTATASANDATASPDVDDGLTSYERQRLANIARNQERMAHLNLPTLAKEVAPAAAAPARQRGVAASRRRKADTEALPPRKSLRSQGLNPDGVTIAEEKADGRVILSNGDAVAPLFAEAPRMARPAGDVPFRSSNGTPDTDAAFLSLLRCCAAPPSADAQPRVAQLAGSVLAPERVSKITSKGVTHLGFMPRADIKLLAAADKEGGVGLWRVDGPEVADDVEDDPSFRSFRPHAQYISGLRWSAAGKLYTCSYDGSLRLLDAEKEQWTELFASDVGDEFSAFDVTADGSACYVADNVGGLRLLDTRTGKADAPWSLHERRINTVHMEPGSSNFVATACGDAHVCVWDLRTLGRKAKPVAALQHGKSCQAAYWAPDSSLRLLTTSYDNTLNVWTDLAKGGVKATEIKHDNETGRWLLPLRAIWSPTADAVVVGSMRRETEFICPKSGNHLKRLYNAELMTAVPSRHACHPLLPAVAAATASGRVHVWEPPHAA